MAKLVIKLMQANAIQTWVQNPKQTSAATSLLAKIVLQVSTLFVHDS